MINKKFPDLTTQGQKTFALVILLIICLVIYSILPPLIVFFKNLWLAAILGIPLLFLILNYEIIWEYMKKLSWDMTKKIISSDPLWHMYRYYDYLVKKTDNLEQSIIDITTVRNQNVRKIVELQEDVDKYTHQLSKVHEGSVNEKVIKTRIATTQKSIDKIIPIVDTIDKQTTQLKEVLTYWKADNEILKAELDGKKQEYEMMKELSKATNTASSWLGDNSKEMKLFKESINQMEISISKYTANVDNFENKVKPHLTIASANLDYNAEEGDRIIEKLRQQRLSI